MRVVFRVDAAVRIGTGHLMRCLTLAESLRQRGVQVRFISREHVGNQVALLRQRGISVSVLPAPANGVTVSSEGYADWLGVTQAEDAEQTIQALDGERPDWLVLDNYALGVEWEHRIRQHVERLMVIDDLADRQHYCDILLDQNYSPNGEQRYADLVPENCKLLMGPNYALLRPEYSVQRKTFRDRDGQVKRVLVFFGGSDPQNVTGLALEALSCPGLEHLEVDVVVGANNPNREGLEAQVRQRRHTRMYGPRPHLADLMSQADLAIGAGGATNWERICLGLPTVVVSIAENQRSASEALAEAGLIYYAGRFPGIGTDHLKRLLLALVQNAQRLTDLTMRNQVQVDGLGALRLVEVMRPSAIDETRLRPACEEDIVIYYNWANDPEVRKNAINTFPIPWATHRAWFERKLQDVNSRLFVLEAVRLPVGQIRFDREGSKAHISYSLDSIARGRGWGARLLSLGTDAILKIEPVRLCAEVKVENNASSAVFLRMGYTETSSANGKTYRSFYLDPIASDRDG